MTRTWLAAALALTMISGAALAQDAASGGLTARDVTGKRLLDANGVLIGHIESADRDKATVRTPHGQRITVDMAKLSLGNGPHTVIEEGDSDADKLNTAEDESLK